MNGGIAQLGEHLPCKQGVMSSNLIISTGWNCPAFRTLKIAHRPRTIQQNIRKNVCEELSRNKEFKKNSELEKQDIRNGNIATRSF